MTWMKSLLQQECLDLPVLHAVVVASKNGILIESFREQSIFHVTDLRNTYVKMTTAISTVGEGYKEAVSICYATFVDASKSDKRNESAAARNNKGGAM
ncbi:hypothetical protein [Lysinibacillus macroides]|uniref:hypothetical protein n=1 Tax=Lysinibacillus macroides TaxID=33935 RepID=UPI001F29A5F3|nr:hypothetical protein [Lysinibacillus macroides]